MACMKIAFLATLLGAALIQPGSCGFGSKILHLSSRVPYDAVHGELNIHHGGRSGKAECKPVALWALVSPGIAYPTAEEIERFSAIETLKEEILENARNGKVDLDPELVNLLEYWKMSFTPKQAEHLTEEGRKETMEYMKRLQATFPTIFTEELADRIVMRTTSNVGARDTATAILMALNNKTKLEEMEAIEETLENGCVSWDEVKKRTEVIVEKYRKNVLTKIVAQMAERLGLESLKQDLVRDVYRLCTYETAIVNLATLSPWCSIFKLNEMEAFEYEEDLLSFYNGGPGSALSTAVDGKVLCGMEADMINSFQLYEPGRRLTIQVASKQTMNAWISAHGFYPFENMPTNGVKPARNWRNTMITPSLGNALTVLHNCGKEGHYLTMHVNERRRYVPRCIFEENHCTLEVYSRETELEPWWCNKDYCNKVAV